METADKDNSNAKQKISEEYLSSLADLNVNSKPLINMLTILAEENIEHADAIVKVVEQHIAKVDPEVKLPILYLIDSIVKNVGGQYIQLFSQCIVNIFVGVFDMVKENIREKMYALRQTWVEVFPPQKLYILDVKVRNIDQNWPITAKVPTPAIHVNPKFLSPESNKDTANMQAKLLAKQRELLELQNRKLEIELEATKRRLKQQEERLQTNPNSATVLDSVTAPQTTAVPQHNIHINKNYPFNNVRPNLKKNAPATVVPNAIPPAPGNTIPTNRPRIAPVNPALINTLSRRDPRLARQQQQLQEQQKQQQSQQESFKLEQMQPTARNSKESLLNTNQSKFDKSKDTEIQKPSKEDIQQSYAKKRLEEKSIDDKTNSRQRTKHMSKDRKSQLDKDFKSSRQNEKVRSSNNRHERQKEKERHRDRDKRYGDKMKIKEAIDNKIKMKNDAKLKESIEDSIEIPSPPKLGEIPFIDRNSNQKRTQPAVKEVKQRDGNLVSGSNKDKDNFEKKIKLSASIESTGIEKKSGIASPIAAELVDLKEVTTPSSGVLNSATKEKLNKIPKLEQKIETDEGISDLAPKAENLNQNKDIDLRQITDMEVDINSKDLKTVNDNLNRKQDGRIESTSKTEKILDDNHPVDYDQKVTLKKRPSTDEYNFDEPIFKKSKLAEVDQKIDILFGTEDVDLRKLPLASGEVIPPPPPLIINEDETWAKFKGTTNNFTEKNFTKSSLDDVRAKLAKAAKNNSYTFSKSTKKSIKKNIVEDINEDSQDGTSENIRTIISQAQELLESKSISTEQYNTLVKTAMQINETNKLKEAQRRESLSLKNEKENQRNDDSKSFLLSNLSPKEQRKKLPKIPKTTGSPKHNSEPSKLSNTLDTKKIEIKKDFPEENSLKRSNSPIEKQPFDEKEKESINGQPMRRRRKESKWSSLSPWEMHQQKQQDWMAQQHMQSSSVPPPPFPPKLLAIPPSAPGPHGSLHGSSQWQNPPTIIFGGNTIQQPIAAALPNLNNSFPMNSGPPNQLSGPAFSNSVNNPQDDIVRTIPIDGISKEIRIYDDVAIVFMDWDQPREIGFQNGQRRIIIDNQEPFALNFNDDFVNITINGSMHRIKYGFPSRELYIDNNWYECYFGGPPLTIPLDGKFHVLQIEGPPPQVHIGPLRQDLVVGKINLVIDAHVVIPVFLDARPQSFELYNKKHMIQFADNLRTAIIDNEPFEIEYGGLPKSYILSGEKHFIRFTTLPNGILPGKIDIKNMIYTKAKDNFLVDETKQEIVDSSKTVPSIQPLLPGLTVMAPTPIPSVLPPIPPISGTIDSAVKNEVPILPNALLSLTTNTIQTPVNTTSTVIASTATGPIPLQNLSSATPITTPSIPVSSTTVPALPSAAVPPVLPTALNIDELFQKLMASGILNNQTKADQKKKEEEELKEVNKIVPIDLKKSESIKTRQAAIIATLFCGMQCSSCGLRFPPEQTMKYSQHLDWHFRQNRRERDSNRKAHSRKWYYDLSDWLQYEEIEDLEDREKNWFETHQIEMDADENSNQKCPSPQPSCRAEAGDVDRGCEVCLEKFEHFFNEELEEWHLKPAVKVDELYYHPICYKDLQDAIEKEEKECEEANTKESDEEHEETECIEIDDSVIVVKQEKTESEENKKIEDDDDDVIVLPNEEPSITEIPDDDEDEALIVSPDKVDTNETNKDKDITEEKNVESTKEAEDIVENKNEKNLSTNISLEDDIVIQEPQIPFQDLDTYVEKDLSYLDEDSATQTSFANIKIKEEPKDDDDDEIIAEDDAFEDVGTVEIINDSIDSPLVAIPIEIDEDGSQNKDATSKDDTTSSVNISIDGNIRINNIPSQKIGVNKIKINIAKNVNSSSNNSINVNTNENSNSDNIADTTDQEQQISTIPVITNQNFIRREFPIFNANDETGIVANSITSIPPTISIQAANSNSNIENSNIISKYKLVNNVNNSQGISLTTPSIINKPNQISSLLSNSNTLISIQTTDFDSKSEGTTEKETVLEKTKQKQIEEPKIEFKYKPELENIEFKTVDKLEKGLETSGLCSIM